MFNGLERYIKEKLSVEVSPAAIAPRELGSLPLFIREGYWFAKMDMLGSELVLVESKAKDHITVSSIVTCIERIQEISGLTAVYVSYDMPAYNRKRLIEQRINIIMPGVMIFLPALFISIQATGDHVKRVSKTEKLLPSAQFIIIFYLLHNRDIESWTFKEMAANFNYTPTTISNAVANMQQLELCDVVGTKEKNIRFAGEDKNECYAMAQRYFTSPVSKRVFVDELPANVSVISNVNALAEHTDISRSKQYYYAVDTQKYQKLQDKGELRNENDTEGRFCVEVWKYDPEILAEGVQQEGEVDIISLFWSMKDSTDERIEMALDQLEELIMSTIAIHGKRNRHF